MHAESLEDAAICEVPDDDISFQSLKSFLTTSYELSGLRTGEGGDFIVMTFEESLGARDDMSDNDCRAKREE